MFRIITQYFGMLKHIPLMAGFFDALIMIGNSVFNPQVIRAIESIESELATWSGVKISMHKFGGSQFNYQGKEIGHIHSNGILDILFNTKMKQDLIKSGEATEHHIFKNSGWISFYIRSQNDIKTATRLLKLSYRAKANK